LIKLIKRITDLNLKEFIFTLLICDNCIKKKTTTSIVLCFKNQSNSDFKIHSFKSDRTSFKHAMRTAIFRHFFWMIIQMLDEFIHSNIKIKFYSNSKYEKFCWKIKRIKRSSAFDLMKKKNIIRINLTIISNS
jgi:hypothetical protein